MENYIISYNKNNIEEIKKSRDYDVVFICLFTLLLFTSITILTLFSINNANNVDNLILNIASIVLAILFGLHSVFDLLIDNKIIKKVSNDEVIKEKVSKNINLNKNIGEEIFYLIFMFLCILVIIATFVVLLITKAYNILSDIMVLLIVTIYMYKMYLDNKMQFKLLKEQNVTNLDSDLNQDTINTTKDVVLENDNTTSKEINIDNAISIDINKKSNKTTKQKDSKSKSQ